MLSIGIWQQPYSVIPTLLGASESLEESKSCHYIMVEAAILFKLLPVFILDIFKVFEHIDMLSIGIWQQPYSVKPILIGADFGDLGSLEDAKWCHYIMVEAAILFKLLLASNLDLYKGFEHIGILSIGIWQQPHSVISTLLVSDFGDLGCLWRQNDVITSWFRLPSYSNCFLHPYQTYTKCLSTLINCPKAYGSSLTQVYSPSLSQILVIWVTCGVNMMSFHLGSDSHPIPTGSHIHNRHIQFLSTLICCLQAYGSSLLSYTHPNWCICHWRSQNDVITS